ncbi:uncharacterized protein LOC133035951 [Cannabis sativa]|uniref:uncharacterized protein LOC133035951 n=1 Tax=Cannabis sativa TaxID=3483 RepID=UPI0029C9FFFA|nr:uncharacterized protein LOC133035951 [Cannabis sativa]
MTSMRQARQLGSQWSNEELPRMTITLTELMRRLRGMKELRWPAKMVIDPEKRDKSQYCAFHGEHGHQGDDKSQDQSLPPYIKKNVNMISGGSDLSGNSVRASLAHSRRIHSIKAMTVIDNEGPDVQISFNQGEASELEHPHDDALIITLDVAHVRMKRMLIDTGSSANILVAEVLKEMDIEYLKAQETQVTLVGFLGESVVARSFVQLLVYANGINKSVKFLIVDCPSAYNVMLGRPWIHAMKAVASSDHQVIKFPCKGEVREI